MNRAHKENEKFFLLSELRHASAFNVVDDESGNTLGTGIGLMEADPDVWSTFFTDEEGATFHPSTWEYREQPLPPTLIQTVNASSVVTDPARIADLRTVLGKLRNLSNPN